MFFILPCAVSAFLRLEVRAKSVFLTLRNYTLFSQLFPGENQVLEFYDNTQKYRMHGATAIGARAANHGRRAGGGGAGLMYREGHWGTKGLFDGAMRSMRSIVCGRKRQCLCGTAASPGERRHNSHGGVLNVRARPWIVVPARAKRARVRSTAAKGWVRRVKAAPWGQVWASVCREGRGGKGVPQAGGNRSFGVLRRMCWEE